MTETKEELANRLVQEVISEVIAEENLTDKVEAFNSTLNGGRGTNVLRSVAFYIRKGDMESARRVCTLDADKLHQYPGAIDFCLDNDLFEEDYKKTLARWR